MRRIRFIAEEFFRSFYKSLVKNLLLMLMFSISLVMAVIMCSYYFDMGDRYAEFTQQVGDRIWCNLDVMTETDSEFQDSFVTVEGCRNMLDYYEALHTLDDCPVFSIHTQQSVYMKEEDVKRFFGDRSYATFPSEWQREPLMSYWKDGEACSIQNMKSAQVDLRAYRLFGLRTQSGDGFTEQNMELKTVTDDIPVLLGSDYAGIIEIGTRFEICLGMFVYPCRVAGILEKGATLPEGGEINADVCQLDSRILFPYGIRVSGTTKDLDEIKKYAYLNYIALQNGIAQIREGKLREQVEVFRKTAEKFGVPAVHMLGASMGVDLLRKEAATSVRILLFLTVILCGFSLYGVFVTFYDKVQTNSRVYGIYLVNGCSMYMIVLPLLLEIAVIFVPAVLVCRFVFTQIRSAFYEEVIMRAVFGITGLVFLVGAGFIVFLMRGVDTEHLIRQKE